MMAGYRSHEASWIGGISSAPPIIKSGYISLCAFWIGGIGQRVTPIPPTPTIPIVEARRWPGPSTIIYREQDVIPAWQRKREDEEIIIL